MKDMRRATGLLLIATILLAGGCGPADQYFGGVRRAKNYGAIVSLSPSTTELLYTTQVVSPPRLRGRTAADNYPKVGLEKAEIVASVKPDYEKIIALKPDLIAYDSDLYNAADVDKIKSIGADTFVLDATTVDGLIKEIYALGNMVGGETNLSDYVDRIIAAESAATSTVHPTVAVIMPGEGGHHMIAGTDSFIADVVKSSGGTPVGPKGALYVPLDPELLASLNPQFIITSGDYSPLVTDSRFKSLKAVRTTRVRFFP